MATTPTSNRIRVGGGQQGQVILADAPITPPDLSLPLINEPAQSNPPAVDQPAEVGPLSYLIGTWTNKDLTPGKGGPENPYSYNLMPLPQNDPGAISGPLGFILKNLTYYEEITFSPIHGTAANRGGTGTQVSNALLYEQRVYVADGPAKDTIVHFENGIWGFLSPAAQLVGPYGDDDGNAIGTTSFGSAPPPEPNNIFKQISVPHGNSVLAAGNVAFVTEPLLQTDGPPLEIVTPKLQSGAPTIPAAVVLPQDVPGNMIPAPVAAAIQAFYGTQSVENPVPAYTLNPNQALVDALAQSNVTQFLQFDVDTNIGGGTTANISFEQKHAEVANYAATYWIEDDGSGNFDQLQYSQTIMLTIPVTLPGTSEVNVITFPHVTVNTLRRGTGPAPAA
ncbi:heme-binding protein [Sphingomonas sp. KR3-1]|uniref:heme-binding protein n=1 Tax=Sphingomonas sp. KR3-1 TaxID=3156611 RepID=UPI0032B414B6